VTKQSIDYDLFYKVMTPTGEAASEKFFYLLNRVGAKRIKTTERLLKVIDFFGSWVQLTDFEDVEENCGSLAAECLYEECGETTRGVYREVDSLIQLALDRIDYWKDFEEVLAHEVIHLLQNIVFRGDRTTDAHALALANFAIWPNPSIDKRYLDSAKKWAEEEDENEFEFEAYDWMNSPKMVACMGESLMSQSKLWANFWRCPV
jgi:hypothetical protein